VMEAVCLDYPVYIGSASLKDLASVSHVDRAVMDGNDGFQRELNKRHAQDFANFVDDPRVHHLEKAAAPPLIFSLRAKNPIFDRKGDGAGVLYLPLDQSTMAQLDAQHRMARTGGSEKQLPFMIFYELSSEEERGIFTVINDNHKGLTKSLVDKHVADLIGPDLPDVLPHLAIAKKLNEDPASPWFKAVDTGGEKTPGNKRRVTLRTLQEATKSMIAGPRAQNADFDTKYEAVVSYWKAVVSLFPNAWGSPRRHLITKGIGVHALSTVGRDIVEGCLAVGEWSVAAMEKPLSRLSGLDWGNKTSVFANFSGQKGVKFATALLNKVVFGNADVSKLWDEARRLRI